MRQTIGGSHFGIENLLLAAAALNPMAGRPQKLDPYVGKRLKKQRRRRDARNAIATESRRRNRRSHAGAKTYRKRRRGGRD